MNQKRLVDIVLSFCGLVLTFPLMALTASAVALLDGRPVLFKQARVGRGGELFEIHKFRTMRLDSEGPRLSTADDSRITKTGGVIRRWKIDELPQLFDVLRGKMSLVGPRPEVPEYVERWPAEAKPLILSVRPGITDPASVLFRNEADLLAAAQDREKYYVDVILPEKVRLYVDYINSMGLTRDLKLILATVRAVISSDPKVV